jgi:hypothetical protein
MGHPMRYLILSLALVACEPLVRSAADEAPLDAGTLTVTVLDLNGALITPGVIAKIAPNAVATSPKFYLRKASGNAPDCWYGVFIADPSAAGNGQPNNGVLLSALGNMAAINGDPTLGEGQRTSCPYPGAYPVGGNIPDGVQVGDQLSITGYFEPFCNYYNTSVGQCSADLFPEFSPDSPFPGNPNGMVTDLGPTTPIPPVIVQPSQVSDLALNAIQYAGELVEVQNVTVSSSDSYGDVIMEQSSLWVTPEISSVSVNPTPGAAYCSITGNLHYYGEANSHWDVRPRSAADIVAAPCP